MSRIDLRQFLNLEKVKFWSKDCTYWVTAWDSISNIFLQPYNGWMQRQNSWRQRQKGWERQTRKNWMMALTNDWVLDWTFRLSNGPAQLNPFLHVTFFYRFPTWITLCFAHHPDELDNPVFCPDEIMKIYEDWSLWVISCGGTETFMREGWKVCCY